MIVQKELTNNPFGHGDLHALPCLGLQQADTSRSENLILKTMYVLTSPFWTVEYLL